jgi:pulcherriminic acid synthase
MVTEPNMLSPEFNQDPNPIFEVFREHFPVYFDKNINTYILSRYEDVEHVFKSKDFTSDNYSWQLEPVHGRTILQMEGREHSVHRGLIQPAFRGSELTEKFFPVITQNASSLIAKFAQAGEVDLVDQFSLRFPINVIVDMLGLDKSDHDRFNRWYHSIMAFLSNLSGDEKVTADGLKTKDELQEYMLPIIAERRNNPKDDLLSTLCTAQIDGEMMSDEEIKAFVSLLLVAGGETTDKAMANMFLNLIDNPEQMKAVREDRSLLSNAFAETLRHSPPVQMIMRQSAVEVEFHGVKIPAGSTITLLLAAANRDPRKYDNPEKFDISRKDMAFDRAFTAAANHSGFALGRHFCVGAMLSKAEVEIGANLLLDAMNDISFATPPKPSGVFTRSPKKLNLRFQPAN